MILESRYLFGLLLMISVFDSDEGENSSKEHHLLGSHYLPRPVLSFQYIISLLAKAALPFFQQVTSSILQFCHWLSVPYVYYSKILSNKACSSSKNTKDEFSISEVSTG